MGALAYRPGFRHREPLRDPGRPERAGTGKVFAGGRRGDSLVPRCSRYMITRNLTCRLERLEVEIVPPDDEPALRILVTSPGQPDQIIEAHGDKVDLLAPSDLFAMSS